MAQTPRPSPAGAVEPVPAVARLAASQLRRVRAIVDAAVALAEQGGFEGVRLRDVAEASGVALGTLYKYFRSKEDVLLFALQEEMEKLEAALAARPARGDDAVERVTDLFARATRGLTRRPNLARAALRAVAAGEPELAAKVAGFHLRTVRLVVASLRAEPAPRGGGAGELGDERENAIASILDHVWFALLVGWAGGLHGTREVNERMRAAARLLVGEPAGG